MAGTSTTYHRVTTGMIDELAAAQDGVITAEQAYDSGLSRHAADRLVRRGRWVRSATGVFFVCDRPFTDRARLRVAVWGSGPAATLAGPAAAFWLGLDVDAPRIVDVTVPRGGRSRSIEGVRLRRRTLDDRDVIVRHGLRVTSIPLTVLESAVAVSGGPQIMDRALQRHTSVAALRAAHRRNSGRYGSRRAERLLTAAEGGARSEAERILIRLLRDHSITGWTANHRVGRFVVDVAFPAERLAIEVDGWAFHSDAGRFQQDRERQNVLSRHWRILRFTWADLTEHPERVVADIRRMLAELRS